MAQCSCGSVAHYRVKLSLLDSPTAQMGRGVSEEYFCASCAEYSRNYTALRVPPWAVQQTPTARPVTGPETAGPTTGRYAGGAANPVPSIIIRCSAHGIIIPCRACEVAGPVLKTADIRWPDAPGPANGVETVPVMVKPLVTAADAKTAAFLRETPKGEMTGWQKDCEHLFPPTSGVPTCSLCGWHP